MAAERRRSQRREKRKEEKKESLSVQHGGDFKVYTYTTVCVYIYIYVYVNHKLYTVYIVWWHMGPIW